MITFAWSLNLVFGYGEPSVKGWQYIGAAIFSFPAESPDKGLGDNQGIAVHSQSLSKISIIFLTG